MDPSTNANVFVGGGGLLSIDASRSVMNPKALLAMKLAFVQRCKWNPTSVPSETTGSKKRSRAGALETQQQQNVQTNKFVRPATAVSAETQQKQQCSAPLFSTPLSVASTNHDDWRMDSEVKFDDTPVVAANHKAFFSLASEADGFAFSAFQQQPMLLAEHPWVLPDLPHSDEFDNLGSIMAATTDLDFIACDTTETAEFKPQLDSDVDRAALVIARNLVEGLFVLEGKQ